MSPEQRRRRIIRIAGVGVLALVLNALILILPFDVQRLGNYGYLGIFVIALLGNATVLFPAPYPAAVGKAAAGGLQIWPIALIAAAGSVIGESLAFIIGRAGKGVVERSRVYEWVQRQLQHRMRAVIVIFLLSAVPNPVFDVAGLTAGAMGLPYSLFIIPTFLGRTVKMLFFAEIGRSIVPYLL